MSDIKIHEYMANSSGARCRGFDLLGFSVRVEACNDNDAAQKEFTTALSTALSELEAARCENAELRCRIPEKGAVKLMGPGYVRFQNGNLWLLGKRETGWAAWGVRLQDWDDLFRQFDVRVSAVDTDEFGPYVVVEPTAWVKP